MPSPVTLVELFRGADGLAGAAARARLADLVPMLTVGGLGGAVAAASGEAAEHVRARDTAEARWLASDGFAPLEEAVTLDISARMVDAIERLIAAGLPAMFLYLFDEPWAVGLGLAARVSAMLGRPYELLDDTWAWRIEPGKGRGWPPHRGVSAPLLERGAPELVNVWVALSDASAERSCLHFVPLDEDPSYPNDLSRMAAPLEAVRAAPLAATSALMWNANILHWGGPCSARASGPRVSCSFSLARTDAIERLGFRTGRLAATDLRARLDSVALQLEVYGTGQSDVSSTVLEWARATRALEAQISSLLRGPAPFRKAP